MAQEDQTMSGHFIGYYIDGLEPKKSVTVATGRTYAEAEAMAITRVLLLGIVDGDVQIQDRSDLDEASFDELDQQLNRFFADLDVVM